MSPMKRTRTSSIMSPDLYLRAHAMFFNQLEILSTWKATTTRGIYNASEMLTIQIQYYTQVMSKGSGGFLRIYFSTNGVASFPFSLTGKDSRLIAKKAAMSESGSCSLPLAPTRSSLQRFISLTKIIVTMVNTRIVFPCLAVSSPCFRASFVCSFNSRTCSVVSLVCAAAAFICSRLRPACLCARSANL